MIKKIPKYETQQELRRAFVSKAPDASFNF